MNLAVSPWAAALVFAGAGLGALLRWFFGLWWNAAAPGWPWGTLAANLVGGLGVGVLVAALGEAHAWGWHEDTRQAIRLFAITGFLGGLTTFSTFSAEVVGFVSQGRWWEAATWAALHLIGSLALTAVGWWCGVQGWALLVRGA
jgi:CrcB protein